MTFVLFSQATMLGEVRSPGGRRPTIDPSGEPVHEQDDGRTPLHAELGAVSAGFVTAPDDAGQTTFGSTGLEVELTGTDSRLVLVAHSEAAGQWVGQVPYRLITDVLVRARKGRRDHGSVRILFVEPAVEPGLAGRQFVDLVPTRRTAPDELAWAIVDRAAYDRHRWIAPEAAGEHQAIEALRGHGPIGEPASYWIPAPAASTIGGAAAVDTEVIEQTIRLAREAVDRSAPLDRSPWAPPVLPVDRSAPVVDVDRSVPPDRSLLVPPVEATESRAAGAPLPIDGMIMSVPGVTPRAASLAADAPLSSAAAVVRVQLDTGETLTLESATLLGRDPAPLAGEAVALQQISDPSFSFSKTHLLIAPTGSQITVTDRHSTNGVLVEQAGRTRVCPPGVPQPLDLPVTMMIGTRRMKLTRG